jgi:D-alanine-D-alanine ligase-like ATP-grasp enzyme
VNETASRGYPYETRLIMELFDDGYLPNVASVEVEPHFGLTVRMLYKNGIVRMIHESDLGLNPGSANLVARDKACTKHYLRRGGFSTPKGEGFTLKWWAHVNQAPNFGALHVDGAIDYINRELGYPVYIKPHDGACGLHIWKCHSNEDVLQILEQFEHNHVKVALIEAAVSMPDYRIVVLDGRVISAYRRDPARVVGDGISTIEQLVDRLAKECAARDSEHIKIANYVAQINDRLTRIGLDNQDIPAAHEVIQLLDISNLCAGGTAVDLTDQIHPRWAALAADVTTYFGLRLSGVDMASPDLTSDVGEYAIFEVNGTPGLDLYGAVGEPQEGVVRNLYAQVLNLMPAN